MAKLIRNVHVPGHGWYGPAYQQPPADVAALITNPSAWQRSMLEEADAAVAAADQALADAKAAVAQDEAALAATEKATVITVAEIQATGMSADDAAALVAAELPAPADAPADSTPRTVQDELALIATDKLALLAFAEAQGIDVDGRLGAKKLHAVIDEALRERGIPDV